MQQIYFSFRDGDVDKLTQITDEIGETMVNTAIVSEVSKEISLKALEENVQNPGHVLQQTKPTKAVDRTVVFKIDVQEVCNFRCLSEAASIVTAVLETFSSRCMRNPKIFQRLHRRLYENSSFVANINGRSISRTVRQTLLEEILLDHLDETPGTSTRAVACRLLVSQRTVWRVLLLVVGEGNF
ncbi:hypothetical protein TNCV_2362771 [Trichonephila clavipes]|nr:hypothetical protein TNCV_2362771 [Trichonephila clavipes]